MDEELSKQQIELDAVALEKQKLIDEMNELKGIKTKKKSLNNNPKVEKTMEILIIYIIWIDFFNIWITTNLYKIIDNFVDDINPQLS